MASEYSNSYNQSKQENLKPRSSKKKFYKYIDEEQQYSSPKSEWIGVSDKKYSIHDFSFENRQQEILAPKRYERAESKNYGANSNQNEEISQNKKDLTSRINKLENLHDKIGSLLKKGPQTATRTERKWQEPQQEGKSSEKQQVHNYKQKQDSIINQSYYSPYRRAQSRLQAGHSSHKRKNHSYFQQLYAQSRKKYKKSSNIQQSSEKIEGRNSENEEDILSQNINYSNKKQARGEYQYLQQQSLIDKYREQSKVKQFELSKKKDKQNEIIDRRDKIVLNNLDLDNKINSIKDKIFEGSPVKAQKAKETTTLNKFVFQNAAAARSQTILPIIAKKLSLLVDIDILLRTLRQSFENYKNEKKWEWLKNQLKIRNVYLQQSDLKDMMKVSIHQKNPFGEKPSVFQLNGQKDIAKLIAQAERLWCEQLQQMTSLDDLANEGFQMKYIDLNQKGFLSIEDLVCFINVHTLKFYRSRDAAQLFKRFLAKEGKTLDKNIGDGITYGSFLGKLCK